jgi:hypothetical protein
MLVWSSIIVTHAMVYRVFGGVAAFTPTSKNGFPLVGQPADDRASQNAEHPPQMVPTTSKQASTQPAFALLQSATELYPASAALGRLDNRASTDTLCWHVGEHLE